VKKNLKLSIVFVFFIAIFLYGIGVGKYKWFPHNIVKKFKNTLLNQVDYRFDDYQRLIYSSKHKEINCPTQTDKTGVILVFGQSNSANHAQYSYQSDELNSVVNFFNGKCFKAQSPLLGASGKDGEWISLTASKLVDNGIYDEVIVISSGIKGSSISKWAENNRLNLLLIDVINNVKKKYEITDLIWHQGETDIKSPHIKIYQYYFKSLLKSIRNNKIEAPIFISVASLCGPKDNWTYPNNVSKAQIKLVEIDGVEMGVNTDEKVPLSYRYNLCHFSKLGQEAAAADLASKISQYYSK
tara:strand:- start:307 stop:1200 length:894 start_codon:yes stop_codon:yes gene_type:complete